jgi:GNAT superfamily N-acetyltransferase
LHSGDVAQALNLSTLAGWNQTAEDWRLILDLAPEGCFCIEWGDLVVATTTLMAYGQRLGFIGMVLTHPEHRRRGFASHLLRHALEKADRAGIRTLKLDATEQGEPLYRKLGFRDERAIERYWRPGAMEANLPRSAARVDVSEWIDADARSFGADRSMLLQKLSERGNCFARAEGFLLSRPGRVSAYLGPCLANDRDAARDLFRMAISQPAPGYFWDIFPGNEHAIELAGEFGFTKQRRLLRMIRGPAVPCTYDGVYAIAGFEFG